jgi:glycosyltransferase involved in cell wall biosynthesis
VRPLNILHVLRAPVGGLFRHVVDLARGQAARGHSIGIIADSTTGAADAEATLTDLAPRLTHGLRRIPMSRHIGPRDIGAARAVAQAAAACHANVVHGHGAKGGAYARLARAGRAIRVYTPHGGSLHYSPRSPLGILYLSLERLLLPLTELFLFESEYGRRVFGESVGEPKALSHVVHNGVEETEFAPVELQPDATDLLFVGELRRLKGVDVLVEAIGLLAREGRAVSATIVGDGPDAEAFRGRVAALGLTGAVGFAGAMPARTAFARGRVLVVPSRAESLPYIVLEGAAARIPLIATAVGGIPEIFGPDAGHLVLPGDAAALAAAIRSTLDNLAAAREHALQLQIRVHAGFSVDAMTDHVLAAYAQAMGSDNVDSDNVDILTIALSFL